MGMLLIAGCVAATILVGLVARRLFFRNSSSVFGVHRDDFKFSIDSTDFQGDGSKRLPDVDPEIDIDRELNEQLERTRGSAAAAHQMMMDDAEFVKSGSVPGASAVNLIGDLTSDAQLNQEAFEAEMRAELAEFDELADDDVGSPSSRV
mmetsp:Transcript_42/g.125  ORF Transcript_42/g.125 Transcript_42/m.125 type:complete len:149 (-) Transcript_42:465-911(-)